MKKRTMSMICILAGLIFSVSSIAEDGINASKVNISAGQSVSSDIVHNDTQTAIQNINKSERVLLLGSKSTYSSKARSRANSSFDIGQRVGNVSNFTYNTDIYKPIFKANEYIRTKPTYEAPDDLGSRPVYDISNYPVIKISSGIP